MEVKVLLLVVVAGYLGIAGLAWFAQESLMFFPRAAVAQARAPEGWRAEPVEFTATDGTRLAGVLLRPAGERLPLVIYYGGNAEELTEGAESLARDHGPRALLLVNYRGYGASQGKPSEKALVEDALQLFDWAAKHPGIDAQRIAVHGRSLGSGIAVQVAAARPVRCVILTSPFASALDVAREFYPWLPVALLLRHPFDSAALAPKVTVPLLAFSGEGDTIVRPHHTVRLAKLWAGPVEHVSLAGFGHNDIQLTPRYAGAMQQFLDRHLG
jgi:fermentation-respiration switch protein FrsA (DUF1100 family)